MLGRIFGLLFCTNLFTHVLGANVVCYFMGLNGYSAAPPENLNPNLCTHINYAFGDVLENGTVTVGNEFIDIDCDMYGRIVALKDKNPNLKVLLAINVHNKIFQSVAGSRIRRLNFAYTAKNFLNKYNFDGIDIDWEFPLEADKENYIELLDTVRKKFNGTGYLLTAAVQSTPTSGYNVEKMNEYLDWFNVMSYDFFGPWSKHTGQNSGLFPSALDSDYEKNYLNVAAAASNWHAKGAEASKINIGIAFYGKQFKLVNASNHGVHDLITGAGLRTAPNYAFICENYEDWTRVWDDQQKNPYKYHKDQWLGYDDVESVKLKVEHALNQNYGGVMVWQIGQDDIFGKCGERQGLLTAINQQITNYKNQTIN